MTETIPAQATPVRSHFRDAKGNRVPPRQLYEVPLSAFLRVSQKLTGRPYIPWVPFAVIRKLAKILTPDAKVLEFGSGRSTVWFARRSSAVVSVESNPEWHRKITHFLAHHGIRNVDYRLLEGEAYYRNSAWPDDFFDLIIVDGVYRGECMETFPVKLKPGGYIYLDNSDFDLGIPDGDIRRAERSMQKLAREWSQPIEYFTGYAPGRLTPHQGALLRKP